MASNISSMLNSTLRLSGMVSGLDTEGMVKKLMAADQAKLDKLKQSKQTLQWKTDAYREITSLLKGLSSQYFDIINPATNLRSASAFSAVSIKYGTADTSEYLSVVGGSGAKAGNYTISNIIMAEKAKVTGTSVSGGMTGSVLTAPGINGIEYNNDNNRIMVTLNGTTKEITLSNNPADITALKNDLQQKIDTAFGLNPDSSKKVTVGEASGSLTFSTSGTNTFSIGAATNYGHRDIFTKNITSGITFDNQNNKFKVTVNTVVDKVVVGSVTKEFQFAPGTSYANGDELAQAIQAMVDDGTAGFGPDKVRVVNQGGKIVMRAVDAEGTATGNLSMATMPSGSTKLIVDDATHSLNVTIGGVSKDITLENKEYTRQELLAAIQSKLDGAFGAGKAVVSVDDSGKLRFESLSATDSAAVAAVENKGLEAIGMKGVNQSNKINANAKLFDIKDNFSTPLALDDDNTTISFTINGQTFTFDSKETSLNSIIAKVNTDTTANVRMSYDEFNNKITMESKDMGATATITASDSSSNFLSALGLTATNVKGRDASMTLNDGVNGDQQIIRSTNTFTVNGMQFELKKNNTTEPVDLTVSGDSNKIFDLIKGFVTKYNEVLDKINTEVSEKKYKDYQPLTDEQRAVMEEADIKLWEEKAKSGILRSEDTLINLTNNLRKVLYDPIYTDAGDENSKVPVSLYSIGITTGAYQDKGKLVINEAKLRDAIAKNPDQIIQLFTTDSNVSYSTAMDDSAAKSERYKETGLANRLYDVLQDNIRTTRDANGKKGILLEKAGMSNDLSDVKNTFATEMDAKDDLINLLMDRMLTKEQTYYKKFSAMESALSRMNSQSAWLSQQFEGGS